MLNSKTVRSCNTSNKTQPMLSKMASNTSSGGGGSGGTSSGRRIPLSLSGGSTVSRLQQSSGSNGRSNSPQNGNKKITESFLPVKKTNQPRTSSTSSSSSSGSNQNGASKSSNGKEKPQNGSSTSKDQKEQKSKDKVLEKKDVDEKKDKEVIDEKKEKEVVSEKQSKEKVAEKEAIEISSENKESQEETKKEATAECITPAPQPDTDVVVIDDEVEIIPDLSTPTKERKSTRKSGSHQKSPSSNPSPASPTQKKEPETAPSSSVGSLTPQEDVEMETLQVDASPIRSVHGDLNALPAATSTPGRRLFSFRGSNKQTNEVELATQTSSSPAGTPARTFAQISGRRSIRPIDSLTPSKVGTYRCGNSDLDTSNCTNASMNATVGSEIPNSSSFSFSFFGRGRKRERTPPPLSASQSTSDIGQDVEMSPPKRARFDLFSLNLASPFSLLRSRFSKTTISSPSRVRLDLNGSGVEEQQIITSANSVPEEVEVEEEQAPENVTVGQEAGVETPKKGGSPIKEIPDEKDVEGKNVDGQDVDEKSSDGENVPPVGEVADVAGTEGRSRCSIM
ncbi:LOW QUALITY PROTEIN: pre-mRNA-splicing factor CWC22 homolog [Drosophila eugracilis]|uniref:LOW QUALITY PROTEIN: pre-mRNA-splicing factor CWC22 homolog n=1 Tax=Drosophila eugracilis TaxID=29029 RepID=UPI001BD920B7|nr:LOW QUALITY PROTEIN: pre-mRNA-splicing factor CWC22 homolog [Drosophila eugracilis]